MNGSPRETWGELVAHHVELFEFVLHHRARILPDKPEVGA
jgi:hypothetical protein